MRKAKPTYIDSIEDAEGATSQAPDFTIAERLQLARAINGFEAQELAERLGISRSTVANYESRWWSSRRSPAYLKAWARECGVDQEWLETGQAS